MTSKELADLENKREAMLSSRIAMARALAYAAEKRAEEREKVAAIGLRADRFNSTPLTIEVTAQVPSKPSYSARRAQLYEFNGEKKTLRQLAQDHGLSYALVHSRLAIGWTLAQALGDNMPAKGQRFHHNGKSLTLREWSEETGLSVTILRQRTKRGLHIGEAIALGHIGAGRPRLAPPRPGAPSELSTIGQ